jgi:hypothetical protein
MGGEGSGRKPSKPILPKGQRDLFGRAIAAEKEPPKKQQCCAGASTSQAAGQLDNSMPNTQAVEPPIDVTAGGDQQRTDGDQVGAEAAKERNSVTVWPIT